MSNLTAEQFKLISNVMYEPLSYIHSDYDVLASPEENTLWQKIANRHLIQQYQLILHIDCEIDTTVEKIFTHWHTLPRCALFLGYFYSRHPLLAQNYYHLEPALKAFLALYPMLNRTVDSKILLSLKDIAPIDIGYQLLFNFIKLISNALAQRFKLLFSPKSLSINIEFPKSLVLSPTLFLLVLNYATLVT